MDSPEIAAAARRLSGMARIRGPDPKAVKMRGHAFHVHQSGVTTLSASAALLPSSCALVEPVLPFLDHLRRVHKHTGDFALTVASLVEPFLVAEQRSNVAEELEPKLIEGTAIDVLIEGQPCRPHGNTLFEEPQWLPSCLLSVVSVPESSAVLLSLLRANNGAFETSSWNLGWSLAYANQKQEENGGSASASLMKYPYNDLIEQSSLASSATRIAILGIPTLDIQNTNYNAISSSRQGDFLLVCGSPFGILAPTHFFNSIFVGVVANRLPSDSSNCSLMMADIHCLPGTEGATVFDRHGSLAGLLLHPLKKKGSNAEIQLVITWDAIATSWRKRIPDDAFGVKSSLADTELHTGQGRLLGNNLKWSVSHQKVALDPYTALSSLKEILYSVVLISVGGSWASGVLLNKNGLVLTNAHLLDPLRSGKAPLGTSGRNFSSFLEENPSIKCRGPSMSSFSDAVQDGTEQASALKVTNERYKSIHVRLDGGEKQTWCRATVVFVSNGPLDVALLKIVTIPYQLVPISPEFECPTAGVSACAIGHGLLGPQSGLFPSVTSGVISKVIRVKPCSHYTSAMDTEASNVPVMLQTTAAVHPGASGGAIINSDGRMIALITSNARHSSGSTIPHMNFSIPCQSLRQIFQFSETGNLSLLRKLDQPNDVLSAIWQLAPKPSKEDPVRLGNKREKGVRFARFLAEKNVEGKHPGDLGEARTQIPSKI